ncbi:MAG TPA: hypothetical protein DCK87_08420, partial [Desulfotomaculum sp.]|nr:hypothetical protein [Desulfotomaculum sp.]
MDANMLDSSPSPWVGHVPFAFWITEQLQPCTLVELGVYYGLSYFSFCQAVLANGLSTKCYAVDTWQGDEHAGFYGEEVFAAVNVRNQHMYHSFSQLLRMSFDEAVAYFSDNTIDLLHIDGLHTYEAVRHDFETWLPKLSSRGVVLFHDINIRERGFGVWRLWEELSASYPHIEFEHSCGLGVLFVGDNQPASIIDLLEKWSIPGERHFIKRFFVKLGQLVSLEGQLNSLTKSIAERDNEIVGLKQEVGEIQFLFNETKAKDSQIADLNTFLQAKQEKIITLQNKIETLFKEAKEKDQLLILREQEITAEKENKQNMEDEIFQLKNDLTKKDTELVLIQNSLGWHIIQRYRKIADKIFPPSTKRRLFYELPQKSLKMIIFKGPVSLLKKISLENIRKSKAYIKLYGFKPFLYKLKEKTNFNPILAEGKNINVPKIELINMADVKIVPSDDAIISVIIPTKNAGSNFANLITVLKNQEGIKEIEIVIVDSGSTDETLDIAREYGIRIIEIQPESFTHSYSRNLGASEATGNYLLFTVQDALPPSKTWLYELLKVIKDNDVVAVSCAEIPREDADLFYKVICWNHYKYLEVDKGDRIFFKPQPENYQTLRKNGQLSDIACLIPKNVFEKYQYRLDYAEDLDLGIRLIKDGYKLAFLSSVRIVHSHNRPAYYFLKRGYIDQLFLSNNFSDYPKPLIVTNDLFQDIIFSHTYFTSIVNSDFHNINLPCRVEILKNTVLGMLKNVSVFNHLNLTEVSSNQYVDEEFKRFMQKIHTRHKTSQIEKEYRGILIPSILNFVEMAFEYMGNTYDLIDDFLLEEVRSFIFKSFALICGAHLA